MSAAEASGGMAAVIETGLLPRWWKWGLGRVKWTGEYKMEENAIFSTVSKKTPWKTPARSVVYVLVVSSEATNGGKSGSWKG